MIKLRRSTRIYLQRTILLVALLFIIYRLGFNFKSSHLTENEAKSKNQQKLLELIKEKYKPILDTNRVLVVGSENSADFNEIQEIAKIYAPKGLKYQVRDITQLYEIINQDLDKKRQEPHISFLIIDSHVYADYPELSNMVQHGTLEKNLQRLGLINFPQKESSTVTIPMLEERVETGLSTERFSNTIHLLYKEKFDELEQLDLILSNLKKDYVFETLMIKIENTALIQDIHFVRSKKYKKIELPSIIFGGFKMSVSGFVENVKNGKFEEILDMLGKQRNYVDDMETAEKTLSDKRITMFLTSNSTQSIEIYTLLEKYKNAFGMEYSVFWVDGSEKEFSKLINKTYKKNEDNIAFPCLYIDSNSAGSYGDLKKLHDNKELLDMLEKKELVKRDLVTKVINDVAQEFSKAFKDNRFVIIRKEKCKLSPSMVNTLKKSYSGESLKEINTEERKYELVPMDQVLKKLSMDTNYPILIDSEKLLISGESDFQDALTKNSIEEIISKNEKYDKRKILSLIENNKVMMFSKSYCPFCRRAKGILNSLNFEYKVLEVDLLPNMMEIKSMLSEIANGHSTFPNIFIDKKSVGGASELAALESNGSLRKMLRDLKLI
ncbi:hypothetical protein BB559_003945 [Furculomyces boomerangus]|uniref:Glutaredoxin domain-containing protein n=1 Tax=Furculomyces boomerangus TaxID=61424 RepID=A0A2T9YHS5_9FUNG|nr:hypothetical protein BB559_003945 [Furculomyces boomerangus]